MKNHTHKGEQPMSTSSTESLFDYTDKEVASLLSAYLAYQTLSQEIESGAFISEKPKFSLLGKPGVMQNLDPLAEAKKRLEKIGDEMKFQNPLIWLRYKLEAYRNDPSKKLETVEDLIAHCKVDGICNRRFDAINAYLHQRHDGKDLTDPEFASRSMKLEVLAQDPRYIGICFDLAFQTKWSRHENDSAGKWKNYAFTQEPVEEYSCGC